jgi:hypothetical protein
VQKLLDQQKAIEDQLKALLSSLPSPSATATVAPSPSPTSPRASP